MTIWRGLAGFPIWLMCMNSWAQTVADIDKYLLIKLAGYSMVTVTVKSLHVLPGSLLG